MSTEEDLSVLLDSLSSFEISNTTKKISRPSNSLHNDDINQYVLDKSKALIDAGVDAVQDLKDIVVSAQNPDEIESLASLLNATTKAIEVLNKTNLIDRKAEKDKELKTMEIEAKKEIAQLKPNGPTNNTNVLIATREEVMKKLITLTDSKVLDIDNK